MNATTRTGYIAQSTPDRTTFNTSTPPSPLEPVSFIPAPRPTNDECEHEQRSRLQQVYSRVREIMSKNTGILLIGSSQLFFALMNVAVKKLNSLDPPVPAFELIFVRMLITWLCCIAYMLITKVPHPIFGPPGIRLLLVLRGFSGFVGIFGVYYSLQYLSLSDATVLTFLAPMCTAVTGALILKEGFSRREAFASLFSLVGVVLIARPEFLFGRAARDPPSQVADVLTTDPTIVYPTPAQRLSAVGVALLGVLAATCAYTTIRAIGHRAHPLHNLISYATWCIVVAPIGMLALRIDFVVPMRLDWILMLLMIGTFGFVAQVLLTMGLQREKVGRGTTAVYIQIVFAGAFERIFFHTTPPLLSVLGTVIIMTSAIFVAVTKENSVQRPPVKDAALEEGLLANQEEIDASQEVVVAEAPAPEGSGGKV